MIRIISDYQEPGHEQRPYALARAEKLVDGKILGYLKVAWVDPILAHKLYPTPWHFMLRERGWCIDLSDLRNKWLKCHLYAQTRPASHPETHYLNLDERDPSPDQMERDLALLAHSSVLRGKSPSQLFADWLRFRGMHIYVDYVRVTSSLQREGIATQLYQAMAAWLALEKDQVLFASSIQSPAAKALWDSFRQGVLPVYDCHCVETGKRQWYISYRYKRETAAEILKTVPVLPGVAELAYDGDRL